MYNHDTNKWANIKTQFLLHWINSIHKTRRKNKNWSTCATQYNIWTREELLRSVQVGRHTATTIIINPNDYYKVSIKSFFFIIITKHFLKYVLVFKINIFYNNLIQIHILCLRYKRMRNWDKCTYSIYTTNI